MTPAVCGKGSGGFLDLLGSGARTVKASAFDQQNGLDMRELLGGILVR